MINMIRHSALDWPNFRANILCLFEFGAHLMTQDTDDCDVLMHAIMQNNLELVKLIIQNAKTK